MKYSPVGIRWNAFLEGKCPNVNLSTGWFVENRYSANTYIYLFSEWSAYPLLFYGFLFTCLNTCRWRIRKCVRFSEILLFCFWLVPSSIFIEHTEILVLLFYYSASILFIRISFQRVENRMASLETLVEQVWSNKAYVVFMWCDPYPSCTHITGSRIFGNRGTKDPGSASVRCFSGANRCSGGFGKTSFGPSYSCMNMKKYVDDTDLGWSLASSYYCETDNERKVNFAGSHFTLYSRPYSVITWYSLGPLISHKFFA